MEFATNPPLVRAEDYPDLQAHVLTGPDGDRNTFHGRITAHDQPCTSCGTSDTVTVYQGPQHGLAIAVPDSLIDISPIELELSWCTAHGAAGMRMLTADGTAHTGL